MGFGLIYAGMLFLANPIVNLIDIVPDFIGYILIFIGMRKIRDLALKIGDARRNIRHLAVVSATKYIAIWLTLSYLDEGFMLVFSFVYALGETWLMILAFAQFYDGLFMMSVSSKGGTSVTGYVDKVKHTAYVFTIVRSVMTMLPELSYIAIDETAGYIMAPFKGGVAVLCVVVSLVCGIFFAMTQRKLYRRILTDTVFIRDAKTNYETKILPQYEMFMRRRMRLSLNLFSAAIFLFMDFYIDGFNILPDWLGGIFVILSLWMLMRGERLYVASDDFNHGDGKPELSWYVAIGYTAVAFIAEIAAAVFADKHFFLGIRHSAGAYSDFIPVTVLSVIQGLVLFILVMTMSATFRRFIRRHTCRDTGFELETMKERENDYRRRERRNLALWTFVGVIISAEEIAYRIFLYYRAEYWIYDMAAHLIWAVLTLKVLGLMEELMTRRYE